MAPDHTALSYRALLGVPGLRPVVVSMLFSRTGQAMVRVGLTLFTLAEFGSPSLAGIVAFASFIPGIIASPLAGALLDRHGRVRLIAIDYLIAMSAMILIGALTISGRLTPALLVAIAAVASLTGPLSLTGLRSIFPIIVPARLWERANAVDANAFVVSNMIGPPLAAILIAVLSPGPAMLAIGIPYGLAALVLRGLSDPSPRTGIGEPILRSAWQGLRYTLGNPTLRGLSLSIATLMFATGALSILVPLLILDQLDGPEVAVGIVFGLSGLGGIISGLLFGRLDSRGRERRLMLLAMLIMAPAVASLLLVEGPLAATLPLLAYAVLAGAVLLYGLMEGPLAIGLFTLRQRRTHTAWIGRAFAISMALNAVGIPIGALVAGFLAERSISIALLAAVAACLAAAALTWLMVPRSEDVPAGGTAPEMGPDLTTG